jgi:hypothetical protein
MGRIHTKGVPAGRDPSDFPPVPFTSEEETARDAEEKAWSDSAPARTALGKIRKLEGGITSRRVRDSGSDDAGGTQAGRDWMKAKEEAIAAERAKL